MSFNWFVSVDDHLIEPARLWQERVPEAMRDIAPHIVRDGDSEFWVYEDRQIVTTGLNAVAGKTREEFSPEPITYEDMREGCYEPAARVADMDQGNVLSSMLFPSFPRYCGQVFHEAKDKELALACVRAWNDFILEEFAGDLPGPVHPDDDHPAVGPGRGGRRDRAHRRPRAPSRSRSPRTRPSSGCRRSTPTTGTRCSGLQRHRLRDVDARRVVVEPDPHLRRHADARLHGLLGRRQPGRHAPRLAVQRQLRALPEPEDRPVGGLDRLDPLLPRAGRAGHRQAALLGVALRHRHERRATSGARRRARRSFDLDTDIRQLFKDHVFGTFIEDHAGLRLLDIIGEDNVMLECDYPHSDSTWPDTVDLASKWLGHLPEDVQHKITVGNACAGLRLHAGRPGDDRPVLASWFCQLLAESGVSGPLCQELAKTAKAAARPWPRAARRSRPR